MIEHCWEHVICHYTSALSIFPLDLWNTFDLNCHSQVKHCYCICQTFISLLFILFLQLKTTFTWVEVHIILWILYKCEHLNDSFYTSVNEKVEMQHIFLIFEQYLRWLNSLCHSSVIDIRYLACTNNLSAMVTPAYKPLLIRKKIYSEAGEDLASRIG